MSYLYTDTFIPEANVIPNVEVGHSLDDLVELGETFSPTRIVRVFAGYAGWSSGQLDDEMHRKSWLTHAANIELVFNTKPEELWPMILKQKGWNYRLLAESPEDLSSN